MAISEFDRKNAKKAIKTTSQDDPEFTDTQNEAHEFSLKNKKEDNRHKETMNKHEKGSLGIFFGNQANVASLAALIVVIVGLIGFFLILYTDKETKNAERILAVSVSALTFLFGKSSSK